MVKGVFIIATGTDVGKTYVSGLLVKKMRELGFCCGYYKPVLSGLEEVNGKFTPGDVDFVLKTANISADPYDFVSFAFKPAFSPHLAARYENTSVDLDKIKSDFIRIKNDYDYLVVEGAGGIACPFKLENQDLILLPDVVKLLGMDVLLVAPAGLGTINSTVLTVHFAQNFGLKVRGIVLNNFDEKNVIHRDNINAINKLTGVNIVATVKKFADSIIIEKELLLEMFKEV